MNLRRKSERRLPIRNPQSLSVLGNTWAMEFMSDILHNNYRFRIFKVVDDYNREVLGIDIGTSMPLPQVIRHLDQLAEWHVYPKQIRVDNGSVLTSRNQYGSLVIFI